MGASVGTARRSRIAEWLEKPLLGPLQLKQSDMADRPQTAKGGRKVVIRTGDERIEYAGGMTRVEGRITPQAQDALEPQLEALAKKRDEAAAKAISSFAAQSAAAKAAYEAAMARAMTERDTAVSQSVSQYEKAAREAILSASGAA